MLYRFLALKQDPAICLAFRLLSISLCDRLAQQNSGDDFFFLLINIRFGFLAWIWWSVIIMMLAISSENPSDRADEKNSQQHNYNNNKYLGQGVEKAGEHESDDDINCNWLSWCSHQIIGIGTGRLVNKRMSGDNSN